MKAWRILLIAVIAICACVLPASALNSTFSAIPWNSTGNGCWTYVANGYTYTMFNTTGLGSWNIPPGITSMDAIIIGGGGGGGGAQTGASGAGGGGGGGVTTPVNIVTTPGATVNVSVGAGGAGGSAAGTGQAANGVNGTMSMFMTYVGYGGGGGGGASGALGWNGASAGGSSNGQASVAVAVPSWNQGHDGGAGAGSTKYPGGGGGGWGGNGAAAVGGTGGGNGGVGNTVSMGAIGETVGGGGGGATDSGTGGTGTSGGGNGGSGAAGTAGANGWGGGGGGTDSTANANGAKGGDGVIILKYLTPSVIVVNFVGNTTIGYAYPYPVTFTDTSTGSTPTKWNWSVGDGRINNGTNSSYTYQYSVAGLYNVGLTASNANTYNYTTKTAYINLTSDDDLYVKSWLHMNGTPGGTAFSDEDGNAWSGFNGAITNPTNSFLGTGLSLPSNDARIVTPSSPTFNLGTGAFEIEFWLNVTSLGDAGKPVVKRSTGVSGTSDGWGLYNINGTTKGWSFWWGDAAVNHTAGFLLTASTRTHVVIVRNASGYVNIATNGVWQTASNMGMGNYDTPNAVTIGASGGGTENVLYMDEFRLSVGAERWPQTLTFSPPYSYYRGNLYSGGYNFNPNATLRYKTDPGTPVGPATAIFNGTPRARTVQIQNVSQANRLNFGVNFDPLHLSVISVVPNTTNYADINVDSYSVDNTNGIVNIQVSRTAGAAMTALFNNRTNLVNVNMNYYNLTVTNSTFGTFFTNGTIYNSTSPATTYGIDKFLLTDIYYGTWPTPNTNIVADNLTPDLGKNVNFTALPLSGYPNGFNFSFGDGSWSNGTSTSATHAYLTSGLKTVAMLSYQVNNQSVSNTTTVVNYINVSIAGPPTPAFVSNRSYSTVAPMAVQFNITDGIALVTAYNFSFGDGTWYNATDFATANLANHTYNSYRSWDVTLYETNSGGLGSTTVSNAVVIARPYVELSNPTIGNLFNGVQTLSVNGTVNTDGMAFNVTYNKTSMQLISVTLNASAPSDAVLTSTNINNNAGLASFGFSSMGDSYITNTTVLDLTWRPIDPTGFTTTINFNASSGYNYVKTNASTYAADRYVPFTTAVAGNVLITNTVYTKMFTVINLNTQMEISGTVVSYSYTGATSGSGTTNTGMFNITTPASYITVTTAVTGYFNATQTFLFTDNNPEVIVMTPLSGPANPQTWFAPKPVTIYFRNAENMQPMQNLRITVLFNATTLPDTANTWLYTMYGMNAQAAAQALLPGLYMNGTTDSLGQIVFTMQPSIAYDVSAIDQYGNVNNYSLTPRENGVYYLNFKPILPGTGSFYDNCLAAGNTWARPYADPNDLNNFTAMFSFQDLTSLTTKVDFIVTNENGTIILITNQTNPIAGGIYRVNFTIPNVRGNQIVTFENVTRSV